MIYTEKREKLDIVTKRASLRNFFAVCILAFAFICFFTFISLSHGVDSAHADSYSLAFDSAQCLNSDGETVAYDASQPLYARNITLFYTVNAPNYRVQVMNANSGSLIEGDIVYATDDSGKGSYTVQSSGYLRVVVYACNMSGQVIESVKDERVIRSDNIGPEKATITEMNRWVRHEQGFFVNVAAGFDTHSGTVSLVIIKETLSDGQTERTELSLSTGLTTAFTLYEETKIYLIAIDAAGNASAEDIHVYDMFDSDRPSPPVISSVGSPIATDYTNGYTRSHLVTLSVGADALSGVDESSLVYRVDGGTLQTYDGPFVLNDSNMINAYYYDNAGNASDATELKLSKVDSVDPTIVKAEFTVDLKKEIPYSLTVNCTDAQSGISDVSVTAINTTFVRVYEGSYKAEFSTHDKGSIQIIVNDRVGNFATSLIETSHFSDVFLEPKIITYHEKYLALDSSEYGTAAWAEIVRLYDVLNVLLMAPTSEKSEIDSAMASIDNAIKGEYVFVYRIGESMPEGLSAGLVYSLPPSALASMKKGDSFTLELGSVAVDSLTQYQQSAKAASGFSECLPRPFSLSFYHNGESFTGVFSLPLTVSMAVPTGYEGRDIKIISLADNSVLSTEIINNTVTFSVNGEGDFAMVIQGGVKSSTTGEGDKKEGIKVFGKEISKGAFGGILGGVLGALAISIAVIIIVHKKKGK